MLLFNTFYRPFQWAIKQLWSDVRQSKKMLLKNATIFLLYRFGSLGIFKKTKHLLNSVLPSWVCNRKTFPEKFGHFKAMFVMLSDNDVKPLEGNCQRSYQLSCVKLTIANSLQSSCVECVTYINVWKSHF